MIFLVYLKVQVLMMSDPLVLGLMILLKSLLMALEVGGVSSSWLGFIFFLMFVGGILVLLFYSLTLKSNPIASFGLKYLWLGVSGSVMLLFFLFPNIKLKMKGSWESAQLKLWSSSELIFIGGILVLLLVVLWLISKLIFSFSSAFRPVF